MMSPSSRRAWIEITWMRYCRVILSSPSSRRAWIEIAKLRPHDGAETVALLAEGVDRNYMALKANGGDQVALLAEGVDRNWMVILCRRA